MVAALLGAAVVVLSGVAQAVTNPLPQDRRLSADEVLQILRQAVAEARALGAAAYIAVVDRVGNVLAVYEMNGAAGNLVQISAGREVVDPAGLAGPALNAFLRDNNANIGPAAAIAKAITGAYLSSGGNAFSTRTASAIVQENFLPGSEGLEGGPLFGVQFSQLPCSDLSARFESDAGGTIDPTIGPKRSPLGFSADPGGLPLYVGGLPVGAIGVIADGVYGLDRDVRDSDSSLDELIALAGTVGFEAPVDLRAERIAVDGRSLRFADRGTGDVRTNQSDAPAINLQDPGIGRFFPVPGYFDGNVRVGEAFGFPGSGIEPDPNDLFGTDQAYVLTDAIGLNRFPPRAGTGLNALTDAEVLTLLRQALGVALAARAQIRRPIGSHVEVTISVVDTTGQILGIVRTPDAPVFGIDVSLQKARSAAFISSPDAPNAIQGLPAPTLPPPNSMTIGRPPLQYFADTETFFGRSVLGGRFAFSSRSIGNIARPFYPDGVTGENNGPFSVPLRNWSPFYTGLQFDLVGNVLLQHVLFTLGASADVPANCVIFNPGAPDPGDLRLANGLQIFSGGQPIYRNGRQLLGGIGVSGDGIDQDTLVAALGLHRVNMNGVGNAHRSIRADNLRANGVNLRYIVCPFAPFLGSDEQNACEDL